MTCFSPAARLTRALCGCFMPVLAAVLLILCAGNASAGEPARFFDAKVIHVSDGDTVTVLVGREQVRIRIAGIDAPEKKQAFGRRSELMMEKLVLGKTVTVSTRKKDRYGRLVGSISLDGRDPALDLLSLGLAWVYRSYDRELSAAVRQSYYRAEGEARRRRLGLWSEQDPVAPWDYRKNRRTGKTVR